MSLPPSDDPSGTPITLAGEVTRALTVHSDALERLRQVDPDLAARLAIRHALSLKMLYGRREDDRR